MFASIGHAAAAPPKLYLNGKQLMSDVDPQIKNGSTLVPLAILSDGLGYEVEWESVTKKVTVKDDNTVIELIIGESMVRVNGVIMETESKPQLINWRTMVPVRFVGELLGLDFEWKNTEREVHMFDKIVPPVKEPVDPIAPTVPVDPLVPVDPTNPTVPEKPALPTGIISGVTLNEQNVITITHTGVQKPNKPLLLENPRRMVFDIPNATYLPELSATFVNGQSETTLMDNPLLNGYRYSQFSNTPLTARLVVMINPDTGYVLSETENAIHLSFMPSSEVPIEPTIPVVPPIPVDPPLPLPGESDEVYDIVLDPGHGAKDPGALSKSLNRWEKEFNLSVALKLKAALEKDKRIKVHLTRTDDTFVELVDRVKFAENLKADVFISIHANSYDKTSVNGSETYYDRPNSKPLADIIHKHVLAGMGLADRKVKKAGYKVIKQTTMPAILIEAGYLSNSTDSKALFNDAVQNRLADEVTKGIKEYLNLK